MRDWFAFTCLSRPLEDILIGLGDCLRLVLKAVTALFLLGSACVTATNAQSRIKVYPQDIRLEKGKTRTFTALAFDQVGNYIPNAPLRFLQSSGSNSTASIRSSPEGDTEGDNSRFSSNLAEVSGLNSGAATFVAEINGVQSPQVTVTVVDPAETPRAMIKGDNELIDGRTIRVRAGEAIELNAESSSGAAAIEWTWGDGDRTTELLSVTHAYLYEGTYELHLRVTNSVGLTSDSAVNVLVSGFPPPTRTFTVTTSAQLLNAYLQCTGGEHIIIPAGAVLTGGVELPARSFSDYVTIRSSSVMPEMGIRASPRQTDLAVIRGSFVTDIPLTIKNRSSKIRLSGVKFEPYAGGGDLFQNYYLLQIGEPFSQSSTDDNPSRIIIDHCVMAPPDGVQVVHGMLNDGYRISVISSWLGNIKTYGGQDSQALFGLDGRGTHVYNNTYFEAASESVIYGGAANHIDGHVPTNLEFRRCVFIKPLAWRQSAPNSQGETINIKNLFESKNARRIYVEGSVFANHWDADRSQFYSVVLKSSAGLPGSDQGSPWSVSEEIVFENDQLSHINGGMSISRDFHAAGVVYDALKPREISIVNTLFHDLTFGRWGTQRGWAFYTSGVDDLSIRHITAVDTIDTPNEPRELLFSINSVNTLRPDISDSILPLNYYGIRNTCGEGIAALNVGTSGWFDPATGNSCGAVSGPNAGTWRLAGNVMPTMRSQPVIGVYPGGNYYPANYPAVGMRAYRNCGISPFSDPCEAVPANFVLNNDSPFKGRATDGNDPGIDASLLTERIRCTMGGDTRSCISVPGSPVPSPTPVGLEGDLANGPNGDGLLLPNDLMLVRNFVAGSITPTPGSNEFQRADTAPFTTRGDGQLTSADIIQARNYILGVNLPEAAAGPAVPISQTIRERTSGDASTVINIVPSKSLDKGRINVGIDLTTADNVAAIGFTLKFDPELLSSPTVSLGPDVGGNAALTVNTAQASNGLLGIVIDRNGPIGLLNKNSHILLVSFSVSGESSKQKFLVQFTNDLAIQSVAGEDGNERPTMFIDGDVLVSRSGVVLEGSGTVNRVSSRPALRSGRYLTGRPYRSASFRQILSPIPFGRQRSPSQAYDQRVNPHRSKSVRRPLS